MVNGECISVASGNGGPDGLRLAAYSLQLDYQLILRKYSCNIMVAAISSTSALF
jgi:hypothetical protein